MAELEIGGRIKELEEEIKVTFRNQEFTISHKYLLDEDTGQKYTTTEQGDDMMWAIFRAYWERKGFEHFYDIDGYRKEQEPSSEDLKEEITRYFSKNPIRHLTDWPALKNIALHFAQWQKGQLMRDVVLETTIYEECDGDPLDGSEHSWLDYENNEIVNMPEWCKEGDKVKFIIVKDDD